jgi:hypothetical protein
MILRSIAVGIGVVLGGLASQLPEFAQQYRQRLGGALDELTAQVQQFDADASGAGVDRNGALDRLMGNAEPIAHGRGVAMQRAIVRRDRLADQQKKFQSAGSFGRLAAFVGDFDPQLAGRAWSDFEPALPVTPEGLACAGAGLLGGFGLTHLAAAPFRRRRRPAEGRVA